MQKFIVFAVLMNLFVVLAAFVGAPELIVALEVATQNWPIDMSLSNSAVA